MSHFNSSMIYTIIVNIYGNHPYISYIFIHLVKLHSYEQHPDCNLLKVDRAIATQNFGRNLEETLLKKYNKHKI